MSDEPKHPRFSYAEYEKAIRGTHYPALRQISRDNATLFRGCRRVLDIASGQGMMLDALSEVGIPARGVDSEPTLVDACRGRGLEVIEDDAFHFLAAVEPQFDGIYCGHLIEHLAYESVLDLAEGVRRVLLPAGLFVLRWPNPRSILAHHDLFWKDPTHVRFYDGSFIEAVLTFYGFEIIQAHYDTVAPRPGSGAASSEDPAPVAIGRPSQNRSRMRRLAGRSLQWLTDGPVRAVKPIKGIARAARRLLIQRNQMALLQLLVALPVEAQIVARRGQ